MVISSLFKTFLARVICSISDGCRTCDESDEWIEARLEHHFHVHTHVKKGGSQEEANLPTEANGPLFH